MLVACEDVSKTYPNSALMTNIWPITVNPFVFADRHEDSDKHSSRKWDLHKKTLIIGFLPTTHELASILLAALATVVFKIDKITRLASQL